MSETAAIREPGIAPIRRETFASKVAGQLRNAIIAGEIESGSKIREIELAARFGISRGPLREAMAQLATEGLIVTVPYTGTHVLKLTAKDVREIYTLRTALERLAFEELWDKRTENFFAELESRHRTLLATCSLDDHVASSAAEVHFHSLVYESCGHEMLLESWQRIASRMQLYLAVHQRAHKRHAPVNDAHERYLKLASGDDLSAMLNEIEDHMRRGVQQMVSYLSD